jgi:iron complex transport system substrate-binding protein
MRALLRAVAGVAVGIATALAHAAVAAVDDNGRSIALAVPAQRIVSLAPHATEILFALGAGGRIVGAIAASDWPAAARSVPRVGDAHALDLERIVELRPDLVVTWPYTAPEAVERLRRRGIPVFVLDAKSIEALPSQFARLGELVGEAPGAAGRLAAERAAMLDALRVRYRRAAPVTVFYQIWNAPLYTVGGSHLISQAIALCGGSNVFAGETVPAPAVGTEAVLAAKPQAIIAGTDGAKRPAWLDDWRRWPMVPAVASGELHTVDADLLHRPGPRFIDGIATLCETIDGVRVRMAQASALPVPAAQARR